MELEKIRNLSDEELIKQQATAGEQLFRIRFQNIARAKTGARERAIAAEKAANPVVANVAPAKSTRTARKKAKKD